MERSKDEEELLRSTMYRYLTKDLADQLLANPNLDHVKGVQREASVLYTHVSNYSYVAETMDLMALPDLLSELFTPLVDEVFCRKGILDKYIGADMMAVYGSPLPLVDHAWLAVQTALAMCRALQEFNAARISKGQVSLDFRIGINSGLVASGNYGSRKRMEFSVLGHEVNLARHFSQLTQHPDYKILIGENTYQVCAGRFQAQELETIRLNPQGAFTKVYGLVGDELPVSNNPTASNS